MLLRFLFLGLAALGFAPAVTGPLPAKSNLLRNAGLEETGPDGLPAGFSKIVVSARRLQKEPVSPMLYGNFVELLSDLVPSMWAEKLDATSFEYLRTPEERRARRSRFTFDPKCDPQDRLWHPIGDQAGGQWTLDAERPFNGLVSQRIGLAPGGSEAGIAQEGIFVEEGQSYRFVGHVRQRDLAGPVLVELRRGNDLSYGLAPRQQRPPRALRREVLADRQRGRRPGVRRLLRRFRQGHA